MYVSVFGDERGKEVALSGLKSKAKYVRGQLGKRMKLRLTPEIRFIEDESLERGSRVTTYIFVDKFTYFLPLKSEICYMHHTFQGHILPALKMVQIPLMQSIC